MVTFVNRARMTTSTTGTGTLTLGAGVTGYQTFAAAGVSDSDTVRYVIEDGNSWEIGSGTYTASGTTLTRSVDESSSGGSAINLSGSATVFVAVAASDVLNKAGDTMTGALVLPANPTATLQAATKGYVDSIAAAGIHYHDPVRVEKEGNLTVTYDNGSSGVGATLTNAGTQEALVIDGVTMLVNDRVLVYEQTDATQNGIYTVTNVGSGSTNWVMTRATDADSYAPSDPDSLGQGDAFFVQEGAAGAGETYVMNTEGTITFGTTDITFVQFSSAQIYSAGTNLQLNGVVFSTVGSPDFAGTVTANGLTVDGDATLGGVGDTVLFHTNGNVSPTYFSRTTVTNQAFAIGVDDADVLLNSIQDEQYGGFEFQSTHDGVGTRNRLSIANGGDISFYEDTGTTPKFFWDASAESLTVEGFIETPYISLGNTGNSYQTVTGSSDGNDLTYRAYQNHIFKNTTGASSSTDGTERMRIDASGNVGIGTSSPNNLLTLNSNTANTAMTIQSSDSGVAAVVFGDQSDFSRGRIIYDNSDDSMSFETNNLSERMLIDSSGNVGIGTSSPSYKFDVSGTFRATSNALIGGNQTITGDLTVSGGDITLGSTGRIQGIDTVSSSTDAANKDYVDTAVAGAGGGTAFSAF